MPAMNDVLLSPELLSGSKTTAKVVMATDAIPQRARSGTNCKQNCAGTGMGKEIDNPLLGEMANEVDGSGYQGIKRNEVAEGTFLSGDATPQHRSWFYAPGMEGSLSANNTSFGRVVPVPPIKTGTKIVVASCYTSHGLLLTCGRGQLITGHMFTFSREVSFVNTLFMV
ncbi:MAG TPA: hypothetical protein PLQ80_04495 [Candidatus Syntrophosphaera sp.]|mgnify:CR=1 FL=1|nr:hypothetical protein [Candidatus Syntrophosphaera sp.]HPH61727.1 hypothetical protein [Candidatus Syntrophosphaera sp.]